MVKKEVLFSSAEMNHQLDLAEMVLKAANNKETLEKIKIGLITLFQQVKKNPALQITEPRRIQILKECNLNLQFINYNEDVWDLIHRGFIQQGYEEIIKVMRMVNEHIDRGLLKPWIINKISTSLREIAELAKPSEMQTSPRELNNIQIQPHTTMPSSKTLTPSTGLDSSISNLESTHFETIFNPTQDAPFPDKFDENAIKTFWIRDQEIKKQRKKKQNEEDLPSSNDITYRP